MAEFIAMELGEYIEHGLALAASHRGLQVVETPGAFLELRGSVCHAGALGLAFIGKAGDAQRALEYWIEISTSPGASLAAAARLLGISAGLARLVDLNHHNGVPAREIARRLRFGILGLTFCYQAPQPELSAPVGSPSH